MAQTDDSDKTEDASGHKLAEARKKGDVPKSQEIPTAATLAAGTVIILMLAGPAARDTGSALTAYIAQPHAMAVDPAGLKAALLAPLLDLVPILAATFAVLAAAGFVGHIGQTGWLVSAAKLEPKLSKLDPIAGFKRTFGPQALANFLKGLAKIAVVGVAGFLALWPRKHEFAEAVALPPSAQLLLARDAILTMAVVIVAIYLVVAAADYVYERQSFMKRQKMSRQEVKDEHKNAEGDPMVKARLRQIRMERSRRRMMAAVPTATVIVTNPTHYAVALRYVQGETPAPICVAKGVDAIALKIREIAAGAGVPIVEDPPLARALYATAELDRPIPGDHYAAVAKVVGYVLTLARRRGGRSR